MKYSYLPVLLITTVFFFFACNNNTKSTKQETQPVEVSTPPTPAAPAKQPASTQNSIGQVFHYTCLKGCVGGADSAVNCKTCGNLLTHNAAFHNKPSSAPFAGPFNTAPNQPASNTSGVMHYICSNGCSGGSGSAGTCGSCGTALTHNAAFHQ